MQHIPSLEGRLAYWNGLNVPMYLTIVASLPGTQPSITRRPPTIVLSESSHYGLKSNLYKTTTDPIYWRLDENTNPFSKTPVLLLK